jgi:hypothetical protein
MRKLAIIMATAGLAMAGPAMAAFKLTIGSPISNTVGVGNDFQGNLTGLGLTKMTADAAALFLSANSALTFDYMASESGFNNRFTAGSVSFQETGNKAWGAQAIGGFNLNAGAITSWNFTSSGNPNGPFAIGSNAFGIFYDPTKVVGGVYTSDVLYFGLDDQPGQADDNHDDIIIRVTAVDLGGPQGVPEPASWAMLIAGFGLVGAAQRRRASLTVAA